MRSFQASEASNYDKISLRRWARARRRALDLADLSHNLTTHFARTQEFATSHRVLIYLSSPREIVVDTLARDYPDHDWYAPRCQEHGGLTLHAYEYGTTPLIENQFGIREPSMETVQIDADMLDLVVAPGLLFSMQGDRLGNGGGYYDRLLQTLSPNCIVAALAPEALLVDRFPVEPHDIPVDLIVTERRVLRPNAHRLRYIERHEIDESGTTRSDDAS